MEKFYCNKCQEDVELINGKCPKCGTNWDEVMRSSIAKENISVDYYANNEQGSNPKEKYTNDIKGVWSFFLDYANVCKYICFVFAVIVFILMFLYEEINIHIVLIHMMGVFSMILLGIILEKSFKWKAYMLKTNYEISKNLKK